MHNVLSTKPSFFYYFMSLYYVFPSLSQQKTQYFLKITQRFVTAVEQQMRVDFYN